MRLSGAIFFLLSAFLGGSVAAAAQGGLRCVAIDPGHGGKDPGAVVGKIYEKDINLGVALRLGKLIQAGMPGVRVVYTRADDRFVALDQRSLMATEAGADLFISIHTNSNPSAQPSGTETYVMGEDKENRNLQVVMRENAVIELEHDYARRYGGYDPRSAESVILFSLMQYAHQTQSLAFAELVQGQYAAHAGRASRGVKQAGFLVLWRASMPSVLTEVGFISNPSEARYMASAAGQQRLAESLYGAVSAYRATFSTPVRPAGEGSGTALEKGRVVYRIQVKSAVRRMAINASNFGSYAGKVTELRMDGRYKYLCESCFSYQEALLLQRRVRATFPDAFVVALRDGVQISVGEARKVSP